MKIKKTSYFILSMAFLSPAAHANPGAWVMPEGKGQVITNASYYVSKHRFNNNGDKVAQPTYSKWELNPYLEYGMWDHTTIGANMFLQRANDSANSNYGVGDVEVFARSRLWHNDRAVISLQPLLKIPGIYENKRSPKIGSEHMDIGLSVLGGMNFETFGFKQYGELEVGARNRFGKPENQYIVNATLGTNLTDDVQVLLQTFNTLRATDPSVATFTQSPNDDYDLSKAQLSAVYTYNERISLQAGGFYHLAGTNVGNGAGALFSVWTRF